MPPPAITGSFEVVGDKKAVADLIRVGTRGADIRPISAVIRAVYLHSNERTFRSGVGLAGWPQLSPETAARKDREGLDPRPEHATGALERSLTSEARVKGQTNRVGKTWLKFGSRLFYAAWQEGTKHQPKRELIQLTYADRLAMATLISRYVAHGIGVEAHAVEVEGL
jgi:hypothetical protein